MSETVDRLEARLANLERVAGSMLAVLFALLLCGNVVLRYVIGRPFSFAEELSVLLLAWFGHLAIAYAYARRAHIAVELVPSLLPPVARALLALLAELTVLVVALVLLDASRIWLASRTARSEWVVTLDLPKWPFFLITPLFFALLAIHALAGVLRHLDRVCALLRERIR